MHEPESQVHEPESLLAEAAAAVQSDAEADVLVEAAEILVAERSRVRLCDRWRMGTRVRITTCLGTSIAGRILAAGPAIVVIDGIDGGCHVVSCAGIARIQGLSPALRPEGSEEPRVPVTWATWLRRAEVVSVHCHDGWRQVLEVAAVFSDHLDGWSEDGTLLSVPFSSLVQATARGSQRSMARP